ncbi:proton-coupled amino acid transporter-like protein CG1139 isoform X2 [Contarinia nasturtii]|uniref:proton-coupled amino acid transporter-like protein CG1139 isoform X2 n=2 Tax=Contarinia nasturtii TaxID=265458 RepID=UPI0012D449E7|nr:proton-coupled amino acid transporter-like protein CG1139 isoform X2 [Contarinia nasturtii]
MPKKMYLCLQSFKMDMERLPLLKNTTRTSSVDAEDRRPSHLHENYEPHLHRQVDHPTSNLDTIIHLLKSNIGTGILTMPQAFKYAGLYLGLFGTFFMGFIATHCMHMFLASANELCRRRTVPSMDYSETCYSAFSTGPPRLRKFAPHAKYITNTFLVLSQMGFCCVYYLFVAKNLQDVGNYYYGPIDVRYYLVVLLIPLIMLNFLKNLKILAPVSLFASILTVISLVIVFYYILHDIPSTKHVPKVGSLSELPLFFGIVIYSFEGIGIVLPLENNMRTPKAFDGLTGVMNTGMVIIAALYAAIGFFGYLKYGDCVAATITLNLDRSSIVAESVRVMFAIAIFFSYSLQFYIPMKIIGPWYRQLFSEQRQNLYDGLLRIGLIVLTFIFAAVVPKLGPIISLFGAVFSSSLALIFPPVVEVLTFGSKGMGRFHWKLLKNMAIITFGIYGFVLGAYLSILDLMK